MVDLLFTLTDAMVPKKLEFLEETFIFAVNLLYKFTKAKAIGKGLKDFNLNWSIGKKKVSYDKPCKLTYSACFKILLHVFFISNSIFRVRVT